MTDQPAPVEAQQTLTAPMSRDAVQERLHEAINGRLRAWQADEPQPSNESYYARQEALCRTALLYFDTYAALAASQLRGEQLEREAQSVADKWQLAMQGAAKTIMDLRAQLATRPSEREAPTSVTRLEVIGDNGRLLTRWNIAVDSLDYQDNGRTLKVFIRNDADPPAEPGRFTRLEVDCAIRYLEQHQTAVADFMTLHKAVEIMRAYAALLPAPTATSEKETT